MIDAGPISGWGIKLLGQETYGRFEPLILALVSVMAIVPLYRLYLFLTRRAKGRFALWSKSELRESSGKLMEMEKEQNKF